jgi:FKBP-type peptidyl-prolyl cis-trans isomerase
LGVTNMSVGESRELIISPEMGYGDRSLGGIPPQSTLLFHVELMDLVKID